MRGRWEGSGLSRKRVETGDSGDANFTVNIHAILVYWSKIATAGSVYSSPALYTPLVLSIYCNYNWWTCRTPTLYSPPTEREPYCMIGYSKSNSFSISLRFARNALRILRSPLRNSFVGIVAGCGSFVCRWSSYNSRRIVKLFWEKKNSHVVERMVVTGWKLLGFILIAYVYTGQALGIRFRYSYWYFGINDCSLYRSSQFSLTISKDHLKRFLVSPDSYLVVLDFRFIAVGCCRCCRRWRALWTVSSTHAVDNDALLSFSWIANALALVRLPNFSYIPKDLLFRWMLLFWCES